MTVRISHPCKELRLHCVIALCPWRLLAWIASKCITSAASRFALAILVCPVTCHAESTVIRSTRASRVHCRRERASEQASEWKSECTVPFWELLSANQRVLRAVGRTEVSLAIVYLSALSPGIRGTLSLVAGSPFVRSFAGEKIPTPAKPVLRMPYLDKASGGISGKVSWALCELSFEMDLYLINAHS